MYSMMNRWKKLQHFPETLIRKFNIGNTMESRRLYNANAQQIESKKEEEEKKKRETLYSKISPLGKPSLILTPELDDWINKGNKVRFDELQRIIRDLRKRHRFSQALEVSEWMDKRGIFTFTPMQQAVQLDLIGKVRGFLSAENYFQNLRDQHKTDKTYGALLHCYVRQRQTEKSLAHFQKMKEIGIKLSPLAYNDIICLYSYVGQNEKVHDVLLDMKANGISPDSFTYRLCMNSFGERNDIEGMEKVLSEMEKLLSEMENQPDIVMDWNTYAVMANLYIKADLKDKANDALKKSEEKLGRKDRVGYNHLISLHANLGNKDEILRLWNLKKTFINRCINRDYDLVLRSLLKLDQLDEAEKLLEEWESSGNNYDYRIPYTLVDRYINKGLYDKAKARLDDLAEKGKGATAAIWGKMAVGYLELGEMEKVLDCVRATLSLPVDSKGCKPKPNVTAATLNWLGENGSVEDVESFVSSLRNAIPVNRRMYHALIKAYIRNGKEVDRLLDRMKADNFNEDEKTKKILTLK